MEKVTIFCLVFAGAFAGCSSEPIRNRESDKSLRVMIDPDSVDSKNHIILQNDLISSGYFYVIDRSQAFRAIQKEQDRLHKTVPDRFEDRQKYAQWGKLYGVGAVVTAHIQCTDNPSTENVLMGLAHLATLGIFHNRRICAQFLELTDSNTGEIISSVRNDFKTDDERNQMSWSESVSKLVDRYPKTFRQPAKANVLREYEQQSAEEAQRVRDSKQLKEGP